MLLFVALCALFVIDVCDWLLVFVVIVRCFVWCCCVLSLRVAFCTSFVVGVWRSLILIGCCLWCAVCRLLRGVGCASFVIVCFVLRGVCSLLCVGCCCVIVVYCYLYEACC